MLHPVYALREVGHEAEYDASTAHRALKVFLEGLPGGRASYVKALRTMAMALYSEATPAGAQWFLDKTPRYYHILPELGEIFPTARFIILHRNPLDVLASTLRTWVGQDWLRLSEFAADLLHAPRLLAEGESALGPSALRVSYEELVKDPESTVVDLCARLGIAFEPTMIDYGRNGHPGWLFGDPDFLNRADRPVSDRVDRWVRACRTSSQAWRLMTDYLDALGPDLVTRLGYDFSALKERLEAEKPSSAAVAATFSFSWLAAQTDGLHRPWKRPVVQAMEALRSLGSASGPRTSGRGR